MARPTKLTPELQKRITDAIQGGVDKKVAAAMAGIAESTFYDWLDQGRKPDALPEFSEFSESIERAEAEAEVVKVGRISIAANNGNWKAASWWLERKHPERWSETKKLQTEITGADGGPIKISIEDAKKAVLEALTEGISNGTISQGEDTTSK
jgi:hypothetical protein